MGDDKGGLREVPVRWREENISRDRGDTEEVTDGGCAGQEQSAGLRGFRWDQKKAIESVGKERVNDITELWPEVWAGEVEGSKDWGPLQVKVQMS